MSILEAIGLVAGLAGIAAFVYTIYYVRQSRRIKRLIYETSDSVPLATAFSPEEEYKLSVTYQRKGFRGERIESVFTRFLKFANLGREPIRRDDITPANPIKITVEGVRTLDIALAGTNRPVNKIAITSQSLSENRASADITFDYLDHEDGGLIKILTVGDEGTVRLSGDIIGMPDGIKNIEEADSKSLLNRIGPWIAGLFVLSSFIVGIVSFYWVTGSWHNVWLLALPFVALIVPIIIVAIVTTTIWPSSRPPFPPGLELPDWFYSIQFPRYRSPRKLRARNLEQTLQNRIRRLDEQNKRLDAEIKRLEDKSRRLKER